MPSAVKEQSVTNLTAELKSSDQVIITEFTGLNAGEFDAVRLKIKPLGAKYKVVKNRLAKIALKNVGWDKVGDQLKGPSAIAYQSSDASALAKLLVDFSGENKKLRIKGGYMFGLALDGKSVVEIAGLPPKPVLMATLLARLNSPVQTLLATLNEPLRSLHGVLSALVTKKEGAAA